MRSFRRLSALLLVCPALFAQHAGGAGAGQSHVAGSSPLPTVRAGASIRSARGSFHGKSGVGQGFGRRGSRTVYGYGGYAPYFPLSGYDYYGSSLLPYDDGDEGSPEASAAANVTPFRQGASVQTAASRPGQSATPVIHEYKLPKKPVANPGERLSLTIVLKDGSSRTAKASWVQGGKLHYLDAQSRQQTLAPGVIDREATDKANEAKNLAMELPPG